MSRNKIKRLPAQPGSLANLRVFSISRNKITRLPPYLADFRNLNILKVERNPIEWPPRHVVELTENMDDPQIRSTWIAELQTWL
ncbi:hypothetical protein SERLA73DRAFT_94269, partial [Serpula lacrymans var. lacrymans S7.3]